MRVLRCISCVVLLQVCLVTAHAGTTADALSGNSLSENAVAHVIIAAPGSMAMSKSGITVALSRKSPLYTGMQIHTPAEGGLQLRFIDGTVFSLSSNTTLLLDEKTQLKTAPDLRIESNLLTGGLRAVSGFIGKKNPQGFRLRTGNVYIGIRGTHFDVVHDAARNNAAFGIHSGAIELDTGKESLLLKHTENQPSYASMNETQIVLKQTEQPTLLSNASNERKTFLSRWRSQNKALPIGDDSDLANLLEEP